MKVPIYSILNDDRAVKAFENEEGGLAVLEYYPADDEFRGNVELLRHMLFSGDLDVEVVTKEEEAGS